MGLARYIIDITIHRGDLDDAVFGGIVFGVQSHIFVETGRMLRPIHSDDGSAVTMNATFIAAFEGEDYDEGARSLAQNINELAGIGQWELFGRYVAMRTHVQISECGFFEALDAIASTLYISHIEGEFNRIVFEYGPEGYTWDKALREYTGIYYAIDRWERSGMKASEAAANIIEGLIQLDLE